MIKRWEDDWMHSGSDFAPEYVALSRLYVNDRLKALVQFHGNPQRHFYTVSNFNNGIWGRMEKQFPTLEEAKAAA